MQEVTQTFTYTARRATFFTLVGSLTFLFLVEASVLALLIVALVHDALWRLLINGAHALVCLLALALLFAPLLTRHRLGATHLYLHLGRTRLAIPRAAIRTAEPVLDRQAAALPTTARYDAKNCRAIVCFSDQGQILLHFKYPLFLKLASKPQPVTSLLFNVDARNELLALLVADTTLETDVSTIAYASPSITRDISPGNSLAYQEANPVVLPSAASVTESASRAASFLSYNFS
jgi:hypothetical protein